MPTVRDKVKEITDVASGYYGENPASLLPADLLSEQISKQSFARIQGELERIRQKISLTDQEQRFVVQLKRFVADAML